MDRTKVEAVRYDGKDESAVAGFLGVDGFVQGRTPQGATGPSFTSGGTDYVLQRGDWVVRVAPGHYVTCDEHTFAATYTVDRSAD